MEFSVGDQVVHPRHGFGYITGMQRLDLLEDFKRYYIIEIPEKGLTLHIPVRKVEELGVRMVMSRKKLSRVLETLRGRPHPLPMDHKERQAHIQNKLATGAPIQIAEMLRDLSWHGQSVHLTKADTDLLASGREFLAAEIALVSDIDVVEAKQLIDTALTAPSEGDRDHQKPESAMNIPSQPTGV